MEAFEAVECAEPAAQENPAIDLNREERHAAIRSPSRLETGVECAVSVQAEDPGITTDQHLAIGLEDYCQDAARDFRRGIKARIERAVGIQPSQPIAGSAAHTQERPANKNFPVRLQRQ